MTKDQAKVILEKLVKRYAEQQKAYHAADYNETKTRRDFIDRLIFLRFCEDCGVEPYGQ